MRNIQDRVSLGIFAGMVAISAALYARLPARVPIHFDIHGTPDGYAPRAIGVALLPLTVALTFPFVRFGDRLLPAAARERFKQSPTVTVGLFVVGLMAGLQMVILQAALHPERPVGGMIVAIIALAWLFLGLVMPRMRRNPFIGVRTPWTLGSDENWARTHRFAGLTFVVSALVGLFLATAFGTAPALTVLILGALAPVFYSFRLAHPRAQ